MNKVLSFNEINEEFVANYVRSIIDNKKLLLKDFGCFDIETTNKVWFDDIKMELPVMYSWAFQLGDTTILGRKWSEYISFTDMIKRAIGVKPDGKPRHMFIVYVHNLSFEVEFLKNIFRDATEFRLESTNRCLSFTDGVIKYMCSFLLSGKPLKDFTKGCEHSKLSGDDFNYNKVRMPWDKLSETELEYIINDVVGLREAINRLKQSRGVSLEDLHKIRTKSGFARKLLKQKYKEFMDKEKTPSMAGDGLKIQKQFEDSYDGKLNLPPYDCYKILQMACHGGNVCPARKYKSAFYKDESNDVLLNNVYSYDAKKFYTSIMIGEKFPVGEWFWRKSIDEIELAKFEDDEYAWVGVATFYNIRLKNTEEPIPYLPKSKHSNEKSSNTKWWMNRLESADTFTCALTDVDKAVVDDMYVYDYAEVNNVWLSKYGYLPDWVRQTIKEQYLLVARLPKNTIEYDVEKIILNSIHGAFGMDKLKASIVVDENGADIVEKSKMEFNKDMHGWIFNYAWYVWGTAWGRYNLQKAANIAGDKLVYVGVDSVKTLGPVDFSEYNFECWGKCHGVATKEELMSEDYNVIGCFLLEYVAKRFKVLNRVVYACEFDECVDELAKKHLAPAISEEDRAWAIKELGFTDDDFKNFNVLVTVSGLNKMRGSMELFKRGGLSEFKKGFKFNKVSTISKTSIDVPLATLKYKGHEVEVCGGLMLEDEYGFLLGENECINFNFYEFGKAIEEVFINVRRQKKFF